jgi:class 3 adenylate cyclase
MTTTRRLATILAADVAGYSRLMAADEVGTLAALRAMRREVGERLATTRSTLAEGDEDGSSVRALQGPNRPHRL